jgi:uracil-DNA glycosylase family 4
MIVGIEPGNTENKTGEAFSGSAGRVLFQWLSKAGLGASREEIMNACYFTSIRKCRVRDRIAAKAANRNCFRYLTAQVEELQPKCVLLLGKEPLEALLPSASFPEAVGKRFSAGEIERDLFAIFPKDAVIISLPHPSPLNRWMNSARNKAVLEHAIEEIQKCAE